MRYDLGFYIPEDEVLHSHCRENKGKEFLLVLADLEGNVVASGEATLQAGMSLAGEQMR
jgi:hypothetical protein